MGLEEELYALVIGLKEMVDILLVLAILFLVIIILRIVEKELWIRLQLRKKDRNLFYRREIKELSGLRTSPEATLNYINRLARGFFIEAFGIPYNIEYSELIDEFRRIRRKECVSFCKLILELNYSGEKVTNNQLEILITLLKKIIGENKILTKEEKESGEKKKAKEKIKEEKTKKLEERIDKYKKFLSPISKLKYRLKIVWINTTKKVKEKIEEINLRRKLRKRSVF